jgi:tRNA dimethylallyltransferase
MNAPTPRPARPVALLMGPTGAGKTDLALELAERFPVEIVSVDSAMVYRGMDIGTGKPDAATLQRVPHRLVDILDPSQTYSAGQFVRDAACAIDEIHARGRLPLLVGGTMLYFRALRRGIAEMPSANPQVRAEIDAEALQRGWPALHADLASFDARAAARIRPNDAQRIQRAIEVFRVTGKSISELHDSAAPPRSDLEHHAFAWVPGDRARLYDKIEQRFHAMLRAGLLEEVRRLHERGDLHIDLSSIRSVGYRQLWEHLQGQVALDSAIERAILATRHLARRQLVWLRADTDVRWVDALESGAGAQIERAVAALCAGAAPQY